MADLQDLSIPLLLINYADDAYRVIETDHYFAQGYLTLDNYRILVDDRDTWLKSQGYTPITNRPDVPAWGIVTAREDSVIVAFRGTARLNDFAIDGLGGGAATDPRRGISYPFAPWKITAKNLPWIHRQFLQTYEIVQKTVLSTLQYYFHSSSKLTRLYITGHSLGGALASICAVDVSVYLRPLDPKIPSPEVYTYASPFVGNQAFADLFSAHIKESYRFNYSLDIVPRIPKRGWTPAWTQWFEEGQRGPEPAPRFESYVHVPTGITLGPQQTMLQTVGGFPKTHYLRTYYDALIQKAMNKVGPTSVSTRFRPDDRITNLSLVIKTGNDWGAGTDNDVGCRILDVGWGPLDASGNDFERGSEKEYDLFKMFPDKVPANPIVRQLDKLTLSLGSGNVFTTGARAWQVEKVTIKVNGKTYATCNLNVWLYQPYDQITCILSSLRE